MNVNAPAYVYYAQIVFERIVICMCFVVDLQVAAAMRAAGPLISCVLMEATQSGNLSLSLSLLALPIVKRPCIGVGLGYKILAGT